MAAGDVTAIGSVGGRSVPVTADVDDISIESGPETTITGSWSLASLTTGDNTGTLDAGTTSTSAVKPAASANWTANDLRGHFLVVDSGGGAPAVRAILENTTTAATVFAISGLDNTSVVRIADPTHTVTNIDIHKSANSIVVENCIVDKLYATLNQKVTIQNCLFDTSVAAGTLEAEDDKQLVIQDCVFKTNGSVSVNGASNCLFDRNLVHVGWTRFVECNNVRVEMYAEACTANALSIESCLRAAVGIEANNCTDSPCHFKSCNTLEPYSGGFTGTGNTSAYAIEMEEGGRYDLTAGTMTAATNNLLVEACAFSWANLGSYKNIIAKGVLALTTA